MDRSRINFKNRDVETFIVTKHSWKGSFKRLFSVGTDCITTYNPENMIITNQWAFNEIDHFELESKKRPSGLGFVLYTTENMKKKKNDLKFSTDYRAELLTASLIHEKHFLHHLRNYPRFPGHRFNYLERRVETVFELAPYGINRSDPLATEPHACLFYKDIEALFKCSDLPGGVVISHEGFGKLSLYIVANSVEFIQKIQETALNCVGLNLRVGKEALSLSFFQTNRFGKYSADEFITSYAEFPVDKHSPLKRASEARPRRILCLSEACLIERNPDNYHLVTLHLLHDICAIIRDPEEPQRLCLEYLLGFSRVYFSTDRDTLIASILDGVRACGNRDVSVKMRPSNRGQRFVPFAVSAGEEIESQLMKFFSNPPNTISATDVVDLFNANVSYSGLLHAVTGEGFFTENKERLIRQSLTFLSQSDYASLPAIHLEAHFQALHRLLASKAGFMSFTSLTGLRESLGRQVLAALRHRSEGVAVSAIEMLNALMQPMHENFDIRQEQLNKSSLLSSEKFIGGLLDMFCVHVLRGTGALVASSMLDFLSFAICPPYCETTDGGHFDQILRLVAHRGRVFFRLFHHPSMAIVKCAGLVMRAIIEEGEPEIAKLMQQFALVEGALLHHLSTAFFLPTADNRSLANRQLSRQLISLWATGNDGAKELFEKIFPLGLLKFLDSKDSVPSGFVDYLFIRDNFRIALDEIKDANEREKATHRIIQRHVINVLTHWRDKVGIDTKILQSRDDRHPISLRRRRKRLEITANWNLFFYNFSKDHSKADLIWNKQTRDELHKALDDELEEFKRERDFYATLVTEASITEDSQSTDSNPNTPRHNGSTNAASSSSGSQDSLNADSESNSIPAATTNTNPKEKKTNLAEHLQRLTSMVSWNYYEFKVRYRSLDSEVRVGHYFLRVLMNEDKKYRQSAEYLERVKKSASPTGLAGGDDQTSEAGEANPADCEVSEEPLDQGLIHIYDSVTFFNELYRRFLQYEDQEKRCLCIEAMSVVYSRCWKIIGPVNDLDLLVGLLSRNLSLVERDNLLVLLEKLLYHKTNAEIFLDCDGLPVVLDLLPLAHLHVTRAHAPMQTNEIEANPDSAAASSASNEWFYRPSINHTDSTTSMAAPVIDPATVSSSTNPQRNARIGPISFQQLKELAKEGVINGKTRVWAQGMESWRPLESVSQLRWTILVANQKPLLNESDLACLLLNILINLCRTFPSKDIFGAVVRPMPRIKRLLTLSMHLPHIVQILLTFDAILVDKVTTLISLVMEENPYISNLYLTGFFFFVLMYNGSNIMPIATLFKLTHRIQAFDSKSKGNSIIGNILPEAMLCYLDNYSPEEFSKIFLGEYDNPEVIWNMDMRKFMIRRIAAHLAEFTPRLPVNNRAVYEFLDIPIIAYPQLQDEVFCGSYYLRHLCDVQRFPDWPIRKPIDLLREILQAWSDELAKKPQLMSVNDALRLMEVEPGLSPTEEEVAIRKAYRKLATKYHPDKNPQGRDKFEQINKAYMFLCQRSKLSDGPSSVNLYLLIKSQSIVYSRCKQAVTGLKYSGYPMLIRTIEREINDDQLFAKSNPLLGVACQLAYHTVDSSDLNAEEFRRENGINLLQEAFSRCVSMISTSSQSEELAVLVCGYIAKFYAVASQFPSCRELLQQSNHLVNDLMRLLYFGNLPNLVMLSAHAVSAFSVDYWIQSNMFQSGALFLLMPHLFSYDFTLEEAGVEKHSHSHKQETLNRLAVMCLLAVARLAGCVCVSWENWFIQSAVGDPNAGEASVSMVEAGRAQQSPVNSAVAASVASLLTPYIARRLAEFDGRLETLHELLKLLNSNCRTPFFLWDNSSRLELTQYLDCQQKSIIRSGECDLDLGLAFRFSLYEEHLIVGEIFIKIYNEMTNYPLENPKSFTLELLQFIKEAARLNFRIGVAVQPTIKSTPPALPSRASKLTSDNLIDLDDSDSSPTNQKQSSWKLEEEEEVPARMSVVNLTLALQALCNVMLYNPGIEIQCIGHFGTLFGLLDQHRHPELLVKTLQVIGGVSNHEECITDIKACQVMGHLVMLIPRFEDGLGLIIQSLAHFVSTTDLLKEVVYRGVLIYLLDVFCTSSLESIRIATLQLLAKMMSDKLVGRRIRALLLQFIPAAFVDAMKDGPLNCLNIYENNHETPELIWNDQHRILLSSAVNQFKDQFLASQMKDPSSKWSLPEDFCVAYNSSCGDRHVEEVQVGGVYLRLYCQRPGWALRQPDDFMDQLFVKWQTVYQSALDKTSVDMDLLELVCRALSLLLRHQPGLIDSLPRKGYVHRQVKCLQTLVHAGQIIDISCERDVLIGTCLRLMRCMVESSLCLQTLDSLPWIDALREAMQTSTTQLSLGAEISHRVFLRATEEAVQQALDCGLVPYFLSLLESSDLPAAEAGTVRANLVAALKGMERCTSLGVQVGRLLAQCPGWASFRDQSHELFLAPSAAAPALTGGPARAGMVAGYLTGSRAEVTGSGGSMGGAGAAPPSNAIGHAAGLLRNNAAPLVPPPDD